MSRLGPDASPELPLSAKYAHLSRAELEAAVSYWQPKALAESSAANVLRAKLKRVRGAGLLGRLRYVLTGNA